VLVRPTDAAEVVPARRTWGIVVAGVLALVLVAVVGTYLVSSSPEATAAQGTCNGRIEHCSRRLDEVVFPTTHNAPTAAEDGFLLANQEHGLGQQLRDGVRGFQIDTFLGSRRRSGRGSIVYTDLADDQIARLAENSGPELAQQALAFRERLGPPPDDTQQDVYLCHNFCELGAVKLRDEVGTFRRFLERNPNEVLVIVVQDEMPAEDLLPVLERGGLLPYIATIDPTRPLPTLDELIESDQRVVFGLENGDLGEQIPNVFDRGLVQEVPYDYPTVGDLDGPEACDSFRGRSDAPLFQLNHWVTPASRRGSRAANAKALLLARARRCAEERELVPNLVAVDFYESGDLFRVTEELNADR
jgi:hypothetical protein